MRDYGFFKKVVAADACFLGCVPEELMNRELCVLAISSEHNREKALLFVPDKFFDKELCRLAVLECESASRYVPEVWM